MAINKIGPFGQGVGGPVQTTDNPNNPTFDSATSTNRDNKIVELIRSDTISDWERNFLLTIFGIDRMTAKQRRVFIRVCARVKGLTRQDPEATNGGCDGGK